MNWKELKPIDLSLIQPVDFPENKYYATECTKKQIVLHHTVSNPNSVEGDVNHWLSLPDRIATCIIVDIKGIAHQCFGSRYWAHHLGVKATFLKEKGFDDWSTRNAVLNQGSIAIEIDNWGGLILGDGTTKQFGLKADGKPNMIKTAKGKYYTAYGSTMNEEVINYPNGYKGYKYYQKYSEAQIKTVGELLLYWNAKYSIPLDYNADMFEVSLPALAGKPGVWSHTSFREDKSDIYPDQQLIEMLKSLK